MGQQKRRMFGPGQLARMLLALGAAVLVAGCSAGQITQTSNQLPAVNGDLATVGNIQVNNAMLSYPEGDVAAYPKGSDAPLVMTIANTGSQNDQLESVSSPAASEASITGDKLVIAHRRLNVGHPYGTEPADVQATETGEEIGAVDIVLKGLARELRPGMTIEVTLTFRDAGEVTLRLPIEAPIKPRTAEPKPEGEEH